MTLQLKYDNMLIREMPGLLAVLCAVETTGSKPKGLFKNQNFVLNLILAVRASVLPSVRVAEGKVILSLKGKEYDLRQTYSVQHVRPSQSVLSGWGSMRGCMNKLVAHCAMYTDARDRSEGNG